MDVHNKNIFNYWLRKTVKYLLIIVFLISVIIINGNRKKEETYLFSNLLKSKKVELRQLRENQIKEKVKNIDDTRQNTHSSKTKMRNECVEIQINELQQKLDKLKRSADSKVSSLVGEKSSIHWLST